MEEARRVDNATLHHIFLLSEKKDYGGLRDSSFHLRLKLKFKPTISGAQHSLS